MALKFFCNFKLPQQSLYHHGSGTTSPWYRIQLVFRNEIFFGLPQCCGDSGAFLVLNGRVKDHVAFLCYGHALSSPSTTKLETISHFVARVMEFQMLRRSGQCRTMVSQGELDAYYNAQLPWRNNDD